ncbi:MAG TPA: phosphatase PAP2 family protein [Acidimicrobiales bacterium]|nr:phosphatase PAP2 family protein [Acidimicrobiales bacterium]
MPARDAIDQFDDLVDGWFDHLRGNAVADRVFYVASELGDWSLIWHVLGLAQGALARDGVARSARLGAALGAESALVNGVVKLLFRRSRPVVELDRPHRLRQPRTSSFPSGHASSAFFAAGLLSERSAAKPVYYGIAVIVAASRVHVRIHHASDVIAGAALGMSLAALVKRMRPLHA